MMQTMFEKLQFSDEKNLLIQGLPSTIEKQFCKLSFAKNITPLLKIKKIDFALVFAVNEKQLNGILSDILPALHDEAKLWIAYPKKTSKIASDLNRDCSWDEMIRAGYESTQQVSLDHVWNAVQFRRAEHEMEMDSVMAPVMEVSAKRRRQ
ncbi:MAG: hypothetical protein WKF97_04115 [Chitinophagaceae bacterium]